MSALHERAACTFIPETTYGSTGAASPVRVCVIDLGTNSFHAIIVDAHPNGSYQVVDRLREMVHLGEHGLDANRLPEAAMDRGLEALTRIKLLAEGWDVREYLSFATSAIREATNGGVFIERASDELGLRIRPISGEKEARLIFQGVSRTEEFTKPSLVMDIGGGSVEFIVVNNDAPVYSTSLKLGAARMTEQFVTTDPMSEDEQARLRAHFTAALEDVVDACREHGVVRVVGSSGTMKSLARVALEQEDFPHRSPFQMSVPISDVRSALRWVMQATADERVGHPAIEPRRIDQIGAGAVLLDTLCTGLPSIRHFTVSPNALREGMVVHFLDSNYDRLQRMARFRNPRRRSVHEIAYRFQWEEDHAQHVAATATFLFDVCRPLYDGPASDMELLEYAALLHDVGYLVTHDEHHEHSHYLIEHADLQGFRSEEVSIIASVARHHRGAVPEEQTEQSADLSAEEQRRVRQLAAFLRVAENLDRSHFQNVVALRASLTDTAVHMLVATKGDPQLEVWAAQEHGTLFEDVFDRDVHVAPTEIPVQTNGEASSSPVPRRPLQS